MNKVVYRKLSTEIVPFRIRRIIKFRKENGRDLATLHLAADLDIAPSNGIHKKPIKSDH